jgi:hypothetical protein
VLGSLQHAADNATMPKYILLESMRAPSLWAGTKSHTSTSKRQNSSGGSGVSLMKYSLQISAYQNRGLYHPIFHET